MRRLLIFMLLLGPAGPATAANLATTAEPKPAGVIYEGGGRVGGDTVGDATVIPSNLGFYDDFGSTCGYVNDYDEVCPYSGSTSPDVVYSWVAPGGIPYLDIDLCASTYDTKVYVYQDGVGDPIACNDDFGCGYSGWQSKLENVPVVGGHTYYIVVDGYGGACGDYQLSVIPGIGPIYVPCPDGALQEGEPPCEDNYWDTYDGGCNSEGWVAIDAQEAGCATMCGKSCTYLYNDLSYRDTDWYTSTALGGPATITCNAEFPLQLIFIYGANCSNLQYNIAYSSYGPVSLEWDEQPGAEFWSWVGPSVFTGVPESDYTLEVCGIQGVTPIQETTWGQIKAAFK